MVAGIGGDSGKTLVALGIIAAWRHKGIAVSVFKKGPDYIDPAWLARASGNPVRNLDTWIMGQGGAFRSFARFSSLEGVNLVEGNRGLHDGFDARGSHSSAELAKLLNCPVVLVIPAVKMTRTVAAIALGVKIFDKDVCIAGAILNSVATDRQSQIVKKAVEEEAGIPVLGVIPRLKKDPLPGRHLGLVTPEEHRQADKAVEIAAGIVSDNVDLEKLLQISRETEALDYCEDAATNDKAVDTGVNKPLKIGYFSGSAFTFYYPENLEALGNAGFDLVPVDPFMSTDLPDIHALYIGGGFPETHAAKLADNKTFRDSVKRSAEAGLPIYAECGGLMFLSRSLLLKDRQYPMAGVFEQDITLEKRPQGHGYQEVKVDRQNAFFPVGDVIRGHEFHYSRIMGFDKNNTVLEVKRGVGLGEGRDGIVYKNVMACYLHIHSSGTPQWADGMRRAAESYFKHEKDKTGY